MKAPTKWLAGIFALIVVAGFVWSTGLIGGPSDKELIRLSLEEAIEASKEGRPGGVLDFISRKFEVNGETYGTRDIAKTIRDMKPGVTVENPEPTVSGDRATITSPVRLSVLTTGTTISEVTIHFEKEVATKWLVIPTKKWRMVKVEIPDHVIEEVRSQFGGMSQL